jgi:hypothetical protein
MRQEHRASLSRAVKRFGASDKIKMLGGEDRGYFDLKNRPIPWSLIPPAKLNHLAFSVSGEDCGYFDGRAFPEQWGRGGSNPLAASRFIPWPVNFSRWWRREILPTKARRGCGVRDMEPRRMDRLFALNAARPRTRRAGGPRPRRFCADWGESRTLRAQKQDEWRSARRRFGAKRQEHLMHQQRSCRWFPDW